MKVLVDTNVIMDFLIKREPYKEDATKIIKLCSDKTILGYIAAHTIANLFFILRKNYPAQERRQMLLAICKVFDISGLDKEKILAALINEGFNDFEDCLQAECAMEVKADYIITRNPSDFTNSVIKVLEPKDFLDKYM